MSMSSPNKQDIADLVAQYGSSSSTAWLEFDRYKLWQPTEPIPESSFTPIQGYMEKDPYIFAWGNPLVSSPAALPAVARQFVQFCEAQGKRPVWSCVDRDLEEVLGSKEFGWSTVSCIYEDVVDPGHVIELTSPEAKGKEGQKVVKDLKKNLYRANKYDVRVKEVLRSEWTEEDKVAVEKGIHEWKASKSGVQIASTTLQPWLDSQHRRYWLAKKDNVPVGILILTPIQACSWQIKNAVSFPSAPKGTSEALIYTALRDLHEQEEQAHASGQKIPHPSNGLVNGQAIQPSTPRTGLLGTPPPAYSDSSSSSEASSESSVSIGSTSISSASASSNGATPDDNISPASSNPTTPTGEDGPGPSVNGGDLGASKSHHRDENRVTVTFGISASPEFHPVRNLGGWKVKALSKTYGKVASGAKLIQRGEFRSKFDSEHDPVYVCYPSDGFGLDAVNALLKVLRK